MPHRNVGHCFYNIFPSCLNCSSSEAETRILCVYVPLGFARGAMLGSAQTVRRAKPRREIQCIYTHPSASLGVLTSASLGVHTARKLFAERSRDEKFNAYTPTPRLRSGCNARLRSGCNPRLRSGCNHSSPIGLTSLLLLWSY